MTYEALLIPAMVLEPVRAVEYSQPGDLSHLLRREIGCDIVDRTPQLRSRFGPFILWLDDVGLHQHPIRHNDRAIALCRAVGYDVADLAGAAVVTGGAAGSGDIRTIPPALRDWLLRAFNRPPAATAGVEPVKRRAELPARHGRRASSPARTSDRDASPTRRADRGPALG